MHFKNILVALDLMSGNVYKKIRQDKKENNILLCDLKFTN